MGRTSARTWWAFGLTGALCLLLAVGVGVHVALRWEPSVIGHVEVGEWMEFDTFRIRVEHTELADVLQGDEYTGELRSDTAGMKLLLVRLHVDRHEQPPEDWSEDMDAVCNIRIYNSDGLLMEDDSYRGAEGPVMSSCTNGTDPGDEGDEWGDVMSFKSQKVVSVTPDPLSSFTLQVLHLRGSERDHVWTSSLA